MLTIKNNILAQVILQKVSNNMTPIELRTICESLNPGGQTKLSALTGYNVNHINRMIKGTRAINDRAAIVIKTATKGEGARCP